MQLKSRSNSQHRNVFFLSKGIGRGHKQKIDELENKEGGAKKKSLQESTDITKAKRAKRISFRQTRRSGAAPQEQ